MYQWSAVPPELDELPPPPPELLEPPELLVLPELPPLDDEPPESGPGWPTGGEELQPPTAQGITPPTAKRHTVIQASVRVMAPLLRIRRTAVRPS
jgi:hypothetical protein